MEKNLVSTNVLYQKKLFRNKYARVRIPGILALRNGKIIVYFEGRKSFYDWSHIDIVSAISGDGGKTFSPFKILVDGIGKKLTANNPVMLEDKDGRVHFLYCIDYASPASGGGVYHCVSTDGGKTFSAAVCITEVFKPLGASVIALGPGHGATAKNGDLIVPFWFVKKSEAANARSHSPSYLATLYSTDDGKNWQLGEEVPTKLKSVNETAIVATDDGILLNSRVHRLGYRATSFSKNGYSDWTENTAEQSLIDPTCCGAMVADTEKNLYFVNCESQTAREKLSVKIKKPTAKQWENLVLVEAGVAGYSDIATLNDTIIVVYETNFGKKEIVKVYK